MQTNVTATGGLSGLDAEAFEKSLVAQRWTTEQQAAGQRTPQH
jgi:hypothetical protein